MTAAPRRPPNSKTTHATGPRALPAVGAVVEELRRGSEAVRRADGELLTYLARRALARHRRRLLDQTGGEAPDLKSLVAEVEGALAAWRAGSSTCRVINATGVILHSGLGRAMLPAEALRALAGAEGYVLLEVDRAHGRRRRRDHFLEELLCHLTGAEAALVVNNNAAATMLLLNTLAAGREVVVSRSQMVEIGGSYRLPDVMEASGCRLREVGATNRSYPRDYESAIGPDTGALMLVHTSNYRIVGFTAHVGIEEMVAIGRRSGVPVIHDLGSGCLLDARALGVGDEPTVAASTRAGADVICFSGDKMIGGPQAGIIVGRKAWVERARENPMARALRIDKLTAIALEATLKLYLEPSALTRRVPALRMLTEAPRDVARRARDLAEAIRADQRDEGEALSVELVEATSEMGSGALPAVGIPTTCVALGSPRMSAEELARALRRRPIPIFTRIRDDRVLLDVRTLLPGDGEEVAAALRHCQRPRRAVPSG